MQQQSGGGADNTNPVGLSDALIDSVETGDEQEIKDAEQEGDQS